MKVRNNRKFMSGILYIYWYEDDNIYGKRICLHSEYDKELTLKDIEWQYPKVKMVIFESELFGEVYKYQNHKGIGWELTGNTQGYA